MADATLLERDCKPLLGFPVGEVLAALGVPVEQCLVFDEPPGVGRGVSWSGPDGVSLLDWVARQAGIFRLGRDCDATEFLPLRAVGIEVWQAGQPGRGREWWAGGSRFSKESQEAQP